MAVKGVMGGNKIFRTGGTWSKAMLMNMGVKRLN